MQALTLGIGERKGGHLFYSAQLDKRIGMVDWLAQLKATVPLIEFKD